MANKTYKALQKPAVVTIKQAGKKLIRVEFSTTSEMFPCLAGKLDRAVTTAMRQKLFPKSIVGR